MAGLGARKAGDLMVAVDDEVSWCVVLHQSADGLFDPVVGRAPSQRQRRRRCQGWNPPGL